MTQSHKQGYQVNNRQHHSDGGKLHHPSQMMSAGTPKVSPFVIPETPRTDESLKGTPQKFKSPNSLVRDLTQQMMSMDTAMKSPQRDALNTIINPQSQNNSKRK